MLRKSPSPKPIAVKPFLETQMFVSLFLPTLPPPSFQSPGIIAANPSIVFPKHLAFFLDGTFIKGLTKTGDDYEVKATHVELAERISKFFGKSSQKMVEFLQTSVGIIHKHHAESITTFIKESVDEELKENDLKQVQKKRINLCAEGNISVGKTTFLQRIANETLELRDLVEIVPEPIDKWQDVGPDHFNILDAFYAEPERYAYAFQNYVFVTRVMQEKESSGGIKPLRLMKRSVFSDRMIYCYFCPAKLFSFP